MEFPEARILVFAKAPIPGRTKTRLIPALGQQGAAELQGRLIHHTLKTATQSNLCQVELWSAEEHAHPFFHKCSERYDISLKQQRGTDLGQRMSLALSETLKNSPYALLVGSDCPSLTKHDLQSALQALKKDQDCVISPATDGGYVLIGLSRFHADVFKKIPWGTEKVFSETCKRLTSLNWQYCELNAHNDIDRPEDLHHCTIPHPAKH